MPRTLPGVDRELVGEDAAARDRRRPGVHPRASRPPRTGSRRCATRPSCRIHDWWREPGAAYVVMRRLPGGTLRDRLQRSPLAASRGRHAGRARRRGARGRAAARARARQGHGRQRAVRRLRASRSSPTSGSVARRARARGRRARVRGAGRPGAGRERRLAGRSPTCSRHRTGCTVEELTAAAADRARRSRARGDPRTQPVPGPARVRRGRRGELLRPRRARSTRCSARLSGDGAAAAGWCCWSGASGTGKSSAVRAGLLPRLRAGGATGSESLVRRDHAARRSAVQGAGGEPAHDRGGRHRRSRRGARGRRRHRPRPEEAWSPRTVSCCWWSTSSRSCSRCHRRPSSGRSWRR